MIAIWGCVATLLFLVLLPICWLLLDKLLRVQESLKAAKESEDTYATKAGRYAAEAHYYATQWGFAMYEIKAWEERYPDEEDEEDDEDFDDLCRRLKDRGKIKL